MNYKTKTMDYEKLDKIFSKYEQIGNYVHRDRFDSLFEEIIELHEKSINKNSVIPDVSLSCYLFKVDGEDCFVLGENIADAIDRLEKEEPNAEYELVHSKSLDCIY